MLGAIRRICRKLGVDLVRYDHHRRLAEDSTFAMQHLLAGRTVKTVFDVGANLGQSARFYRSLFSEAEIHCFEPNTSTFRELKESCSSDRRIHTWPLAIAESNGPKTFFVNSDHTTSSLLASSDQLSDAGLREKLRTERSVTVNCRTLDDFCRQESVAEIDLLKLDIQGAELMALEGAAEMLKADRIKLIFCEVQFSPLYADACEFAGISGFLRQFGYSLYGLYNLHHFSRDGLLWGDAIFVSPLCKAATARGLG